MHYKTKCTSSSNHNDFYSGNCRDPKMICQNRFCVCKCEFYHSQDDSKCYSNDKFIKIWHLISNLNLKFIK